MRSADQHRFGHAGDLLDPLGPVGRRNPPRIAEALGPGGDVRLVDHPIANQDVQQAVRQRRIGSRPQREMQLRPRRRRRAPRVGDDQGAAGALLRLEELHERRHRFGGVAADEQDDLRTRDVVERKGQPAIDPERAHGRGCRRRHAEPPVVVDVGRAKPDARELADEIGLLVRQRAAAEHGHRIVPVTPLDPVECRRHAAQRLIPGGGTQAAAGVAHQRLAQAVGMRERRRGRPSLHAQAAAVHWEPRVAVHDRRAVLARKMHPALQGAVRTVRGS